MRQASTCGLVLAILTSIPSVGASDLATEAAVFEAAFRQQFELLLDSSARAKGMVVCLAIDPGGAPQSASKEFVARLARERAVRRAAECDRRPAGAVERMTLRPATILTVGPAEWRADDEAWVDVAVYRSARESNRRKYRIVLERGVWVSLGPIFLDGPA